MLSFIYCSKETLFLINCEKYLIYDFVCYFIQRIDHKNGLNLQNDICLQENLTLSDLRTSSKSSLITFLFDLKIKEFIISNK